MIINSLIGTLQLQSNGPLYSNTMITTLAVDGLAVISGTVTWGLHGMMSQCTNFVLFDVALQLLLHSKELIIRR